MTNPPVASGLRGQVAGQTALCSVGAQGHELRYRGYDINDLAEYASFEEVAYLLLRGKLPTFAELHAYQRQLKQYQAIPEAVLQVMRLLPASAHPMDVLRTGCSVLGNCLPEDAFADQLEHADRLLATVPAMLVYWYRFSHQGVEIDLDQNELQLGSYFLHLLLGKEAPALHQKVLQVSLILYAEHEFNASTFAARVCASTLSDLYSCVVAAIGTLRGPLHGGANEAAMALIQTCKDADDAEQQILEKLARKEKVMGFGHAVYRDCDPRNAIIRRYAQQLAESTGDDRLFRISERIETVMWREKKLFANADFYHASAYHALGIPTILFTPIFVIARISGWCAHIAEQRANNRIIRPSADYVGPDAKAWLALANRV